MNNDKYSGVHINDALKNYATYLEDARKEYVQMVYDSFIEFNDSEPDPAEDDTLSQLTIKNQKARFPKTAHKGFYHSFDQYLQGFQLESWNQQIAKIIQNLQGLTSIRQLKDHMGLEIKQFEYKTTDKIPEKPQKFFSKADMTFNFKSQDCKILSYSSKIKLEPDKVSKFRKEIYKNDDTVKVIKLIDYRDNRMQFVDTIFFDNNEQDEPILTGNVSLADLEKRAEILVPSRLSFIEKNAVTVCKFITLLKKLYKNRKEKESQKIGMELHNTNNSQVISASNLPKNEKLVKIGNDVVTFRDIKNLFNSSEKDPYTGEEKIDINKLKQIFKQKVAEKEVKKNEEKIVHLKEKILNVIKQHYENPESDTALKGTKEQGDNDDDSRGGFENDKNPQHEGNQIDDIVGGIPHSGIKQGRRKFQRQTQISNDLKEAIAGQEVIPKHKVNFLSGLKMYIKEELGKKKK